MPAPVFSLVIPVYNEEQRLPATLPHLQRYLATLPHAWELIFVDDGSTDQTVAILQAHRHQLPFILIQQPRNEGKGWAVRTGMLAATGQFRAFLDADLATPPEELDRLWHALTHDYEVAIGSRRTTDGRDLRVSGDRPQSVLRQCLGKLFHLIVSWVYLGNIHDNQCGAKAFTAAAAQSLFSRQQLKRWAFDVEILYLARRDHNRIAEVPVAWRSQQQSKLRVTAGTAWGTLRELSSIWWLHRHDTTA